MLELVVNSTFSTLISGGSGVVPTDAAVYVDGTFLSTPTVTPVTGTDNRWKVTFTPTISGTYSLYAFSQVQFTAQCVNKSLYDFLTNLEDDCLGSWTWDKATGLMILLRQNGNELARFDVRDSLTASHKERL